MDADTSNIINDLLRENTNLKLKNENLFNRIDNLNYLNGQKEEELIYLRDVLKKFKFTKNEKNTIKNEVKRNLQSMWYLKNINNWDEKIKTYDDYNIEDYNEVFF